MTYELLMKIQNKNQSKEIDLGINFVIIHIHMFWKIWLLKYPSSNYDCNNSNQKFII